MPIEDHRSSRCFDTVTAFSPEINPRIRGLRDRAEALRTLENFPGEAIRTLAAWERQTELHRTHTLHYYAALAYGCLTTTFIMTQRHAAIRRIETSLNPRAHSVWLPAILSGEAFATVGISHLTTSRQHLERPPVTICWNGDHGLMSGSIPWVTGAKHAKYIVAGVVDASDPNQQYLVMLEQPSAEVRPGSGMQLVALTSSCTDVVELRNARIDRQNILHGPHDNVMIASNTGGAGGIQTSALAIGLAACAIDYLADESDHRPSLADHAQNLRRQWDTLYATLIAPDSTTDSNLFRKEANELVLDATHAALAAAKGAGFIEGHPVGRWCQEALFFLVWSCPQWVADAHLCTFSGRQP
jgi:alkylation response protein AidB-like acyl-CoA dehydrogenase